MEASQNRTRTLAEIVCRGLELRESEVDPWRLKIARIRIRKEIRYNVFSHATALSHREL